jgi:predicted PurR-regulated permease PerM
LSAILTTIRTMGWSSYIVLLIGFIIATVIYAVITGIFSAIPYIGWVLVLIVNPVFMIFTARYFSLVYDQGEPRPVPPLPAV